MIDYKASKGNYIISYLLVGYPSRYVCSKCTNSQNIYNNGMCYSYCPANTILTTLSDGGKMCMYCAKGMIIEQGKCACPSGTSLVNNICASISVNGLIVQSTNPSSTSTSNIYNPQSDSQNSQGSIYIPEGTINQYFDFSSSGTSSQYNMNSASSSSSASSTASSSIQASTIFIPQTSSQISQSSKPTAVEAVSVSPIPSSGYIQI